LGFIDVVHEESKAARMKPVIIIPVGQVSKRDLKRLNDNSFCVVEAKDPSTIRFSEPPPNGYSEQEKAAIQLCRFVISHPSAASWTRLELGNLLARFFIEGSPLQPLTQIKK